MAVRPIDANVAMKRIREYMEDFQNANTRLATCRVILSMLGDENQTPTLRPITREQVEKAWRGVCDCSKPKACCTCCSMRCQYCIGQSEYRQATFCMKCGRPLTYEAVDMMLERWKEAVDNEA